MVASAIVTWLITAMAAWGYPQGEETIWPIGLVSMAFVLGFGLKPLVTSWRADRAGHDGQPDS